VSVSREQAWRWGFGIFFLLLFLAHLIVSLQLGLLERSLWFCATVMLTFGIGLLINNDLLISSAVTSSILIEILWAIDMGSYLITNKLAIGIVTYVSTASSAEMILTFYHVFVLIVPVVFVFTRKKFHPYSWAASSVHLLIVLLITFFVAHTGVNCVNVVCSFGIFTPLYGLKPLWLPHVLFLWLVASVVMFGPVHLIFYKVVNGIAPQNSAKITTPRRSQKPGIRA
jgi:hypothetical protein